MVDATELGEAHSDQVLVEKGIARRVKHVYSPRDRLDASEEKGKQKKYRRYR